MIQVAVALARPRDDLLRHAGKAVSARRRDDDCLQAAPRLGSHQAVQQIFSNLGRRLLRAEKTARAQAGFLFDQVGARAGLLDEFGGGFVFDMQIAARDKALRDIAV